MNEHSLSAPKKAQARVKMSRWEQMRRFGVNGSTAIYSAVVPTQFRLQDGRTITGSEHGVSERGGTPWAAEPSRLCRAMRRRSQSSVDPGYPRKGCTWRRYVPVSANVLGRRDNETSSAKPSANESWGGAVHDVNPSKGTDRRNRTKMRTDTHHSTNPPAARTHFEFSPPHLPPVCSWHSLSSTSEVRRMMGSGIVLA
ncbi:hypothetical protein B0H16DRAFT_1559408 [Mycena metata]|uniref:Uncharacterized protein n=1 Tax=Mycena metata TaxID=1033252 RepID=A0AAD7IJX0_9AGAR|nr:hypothetical protein B0H16DRAFT_1559408 [Mycena metata]